VEVVLLQILGSIDRCDATLIEGWITIVGDPDSKIDLEFVLRGEILGHATADLFRQDLKDADIGGGYCAFSFVTPAFVPGSEIKQIAVRLENSSVVLPRGDVKPDTDATGVVAETVSRFGGLWIDRYDWLDRLAAKHRKGEISEELTVKIFQFVRDGFLILKGAVPPVIVDRLNGEIERIRDHAPSGLLVETFELDGQMRCVSPDVSLRAGRTKMLDLCAFSKAARRAIASPAAVEFLAAIFEDQPKAFQGLTCWNGSQQAIHKDTAYVKIHSNPMHFAATWLALENVQPGTGELEYYVGSHRAPDFLFGGKSKWMESHTADHPSRNFPELAKVQ
jgi:hypothetical protein